jgi:hypothetical protein
MPLRQPRPLRWQQRIRSPGPTATTVAAAGVPGAPSQECWRCLVRPRGEPVRSPASSMAAGSAAQQAWWPPGPRAECRRRTREVTQTVRPALLRQLVLPSSAGREPRRGRTYVRSGLVNRMPAQSPGHPHLRMVSSAARAVGPWAPPEEVGRRLRREEASRPAVPCRNCASARPASWAAVCRPRGMGHPNRRWER